MSNHATGTKKATPQKYLIATSAIDGCGYRLSLTEIIPVVSRLVTGLVLPCLSALVRGMLSLSDSDSEDIILARAGVSSLASVASDDFSSSPRARADNPAQKPLRGL